MRHKEGARRIVSVVMALALATMGLTAAAWWAPQWASANETDPELLAVEDVVADEESIENDAVEETSTDAVSDEEATEEERESAEGEPVENAILSDNTVPSDAVEPAKGADVAGTTSTTTDPAEGTVNTEADEVYLIWLRLDTSGGATDSAIEAQLGKSIEENLKLASEDPNFHDIIPSWGDLVWHGDGCNYSFRGWESAIDMSKPLEASDFMISGEGNIGLEIHATWAPVPEPFDDNGKLLDYSIDNGVLTFPDYPALGEWYQLTVDAEDGITFSNVAGGTEWTMTIDANYLNSDDPLYSPQPHSGIYFVRGDGQGMSTNLSIEYDASKALTYKFTSGSGDAVRANPSVLSINLSSPAVLSLGYSTETVVANEQGATITHTPNSGEHGDDGSWSMLTLVTDPITGEAADKATVALKDAVAGVSNIHLFDICLLDPAGKVFAIPEGDHVVVTLPIPVSMSLENLHVFHIADDGTVTDMNATVDAEARTVSFTTTHFSTFALANVEGDGAASQLKPLPSSDEKPAGALADTGDATGVVVAGAALCAVCAAGVAVAARKRAQR